jgi:hypothetical protein
MLILNLQFGAMVLLDPIWNMATGFQVTKRSKTFSATLNLVLSRIQDITSGDDDDDDDEVVKIDLVEIHRSGRNVVMKVLCHQCLVDWVGDFMDQYPPIVDVEN